MSLSTISREQIELFLENKEAGYWSEPFMVNCGTIQNKFEDTRWTWDWGALHIARAAKTILEPEE